MEWCGIRGGGGNNDGVIKCSIVGQDLHDVGNSGSLLSDGDIDAIELLGGISSRLEEGFLVEDGINGNSSFSSLSVSNDEFSLSSSNWDL